LRGFFSYCKADEAGGLTPVKEKNAALRKISRNAVTVLNSPAIYVTKIEFRRAARIDETG